MLLATAASAALPPDSVVVASSGGGFTEVGAATLERHTVAGFTTDGALVWSATLDGDDDVSIDVIAWSTTAGTRAHVDGDPSPGGGVFAFSGVAPLPGRAEAWLVTAPDGPTTLFAFDADAVRSVFAEGDAAGDAPAASFGVDVAADRVVLRETASDGVVSLIHVAADGAAERFVTFGEPVPGLAGWVGDLLNREVYLTPGAVTFGVADATTGARVFAHGAPGAPALLDPRPWLPNGVCCALLGVSPGGWAVFRGETDDGGVTVHLFAGPVASPVEVLALPPAGIPVGNDALGALAGPPVLGDTGGFAFVGDGGAMFTWSDDRGLLRAVAPGEAGWLGVAPQPLAVRNDGLVVFQDTVDGAIGVYTWSPDGGVDTWAAPGDTVEHPIDGPMEVVAARFAGTSADLDAGRAAVSVFGDDGWVLFATLSDPPAGAGPTGGGGDDDDDGGRDEAGGCGCASTPPGFVWALAAVVALRRRRGR